MKIGVVHLDDLIVLSSSYEKHLQRLDMIPIRLKEYGIKLSPEKMFLSEEKHK